MPLYGQLGLADRAAQTTLDFNTCANARVAITTSAAPPDHAVRSIPDLTCKGPVEAHSAFVTARRKGHAAGAYSDESRGHGRFGADGRT